MRPILIVFSGLPGTGKTTLSRRLSQELACTYLRADTIQGAQLRAGLAYSDELESATYLCAEAIAQDCLNNGLHVIVDAVNGSETARNRWVNMAAQTSAVLCFVEVICSDTDEHQRRVQHRSPDIEGQIMPTWENDIINGGYEPWTLSRFVADTFPSSDSAYCAILSHVQDILGKQSTTKSNKCL